MVTAERARILLIDEDSSERAEVVLMIRKAFPDAEILEAANGLDYAQHLASGAITAAITSPRLSWGDGQRVLDSVRRRSPGCVTLVLTGFAPGESAGPFPGDGPHAMLTRARLHELSSLIGGAVNEPDHTPAPGEAATFAPELEAPVDRGGAGGAPAMPIVLSPERIRALRDELSTVRSEAYHLVDEAGAPPEMCDSLARFLRVAERLQAAMECILGERPSLATAIERAPVGLGDAVLEALGSLHDEIKLTGARVRAGTLPTLLADRHQLVQLFFELIQNAIQFRGTRVPRITVRARRAGEHWVISVRDNGIGIEPSPRQDIFGTLSGGGAWGQSPRIGLAVCGFIADAYDGSLWYESTPGVGTTFFVKLRAQALEPAATNLTIQRNGQVVGQVTVHCPAEREEILRAALAMPGFGASVSPQAVADVQLLANQVVNIVL